MSLNASPAQMLRTTPAVRAEHAVAADGFLTEDAYNTAKGHGAVLPLGVGDGFRRRGGLLRPLLTGAANDVVAVKLWRVTQLFTPAVGTLRGYLLELLTTVTCTAANDTYTAGTIEAGSEVYRPCDTLVLSNTALCTALESAYGASLAVHSPGGDAPGHLLVPDAFGAFALLLDPDVTTGSGGFNAIAEGIT